MNATHEGPVSDGTLDEQLAHFRREGYVVYRGALAPPLLEAVREKYLERLREKQARLGLTPAEGADLRHRESPGVLADFRPRGGNHDFNRWNMHLPSEAPFLDTEVVANPRVVPALFALLGDDAVVSVIASDTPYPSSGYQSAHQDSRFLRISANIALVDFTPENGPIEIWPRSHLPDPNDAASFREAPFDLPADKIKKLVDEVPPTRMLLRAGDMIVRDHRMVHRGSPNRSDACRPMLSLYYQQPPSRVPYRGVSDFVARASLRAREAIRADGPDAMEPKMLEAANHVGRLVDSMSGTDRDYRRVIPASVWRQLSPDARRLLRFAKVEGHADEATRAHASLRRSLLLVSYLAGGVPWANLAYRQARRKLAGGATPAS